MRGVWSVARWTLGDQRGAVAALAATMAGLAFLMAVIYPSYHDSLASIDVPAFFRSFLGDARSFASPEGFLTAEVFSWLPIVAAVFALLWGTGTLAGDEEDGALDLLLAQPIARRAVVLGKAVGLAAALALVMLGAFPGLLIGIWLTGMEVSALRVLSACVAQVPLVWVYLAVGVVAGAALATRRAASIVTTAALVGAYAVQIAAGAVPDFAAAARFTPLYWANASVELLNGPQPLRWAGLTIVAAVVVVCAAFLFERREVGAHVALRRLRRRQRTSVDGG